TTARRQPASRARCRRSKRWSPSSNRSKAGTKTSSASSASKTCPPPPSATCASWRTSSTCRSRWSLPAPSASRPWWDFRLRIADFGLKGRERWRARKPCVFPPPQSKIQNPKSKIPSPRPRGLEQPLVLHEHADAQARPRGGEPALQLGERRVRLRGVDEQEVREVAVERVVRRVEHGAAGVGRHAGQRLGHPGPVDAVGHHDEAPERVGRAG